jgi:hypothetical protein
MSNYPININFNVNPSAKQTITSKEWKNFLLNHDRFVFCNGDLRELKAKNLGAGVVEIYSVPMKLS